MAPSLPNFIPRETAARKGLWPRIAVTFSVVTVYLGSAALQDGPIQVWLLVLFPFALAALATALRVTELRVPAARIVREFSQPIRNPGTRSMLVLADGDAGEPMRPAPGPAAYNKDFDTDYNHTPRPLEKD